MELLDLWLPILITTVVLFFASFLAWAILPHHNPDYNKLPDEKAFTTALSEHSITPGRMYIFPYMQHKDMKDQANIDRYNRGPWGVLNLWPAKPAMGANMAATIITFLIITTLLAHLATIALLPGAPFGRVFHFFAIAALLAHWTGAVVKEIWFAIPLRAKAMDLIDAIAYALLTALIFALLWPAA